MDIRAFGKSETKQLFREAMEPVCSCQCGSASPLGVSGCRCTPGQTGRNGAQPGGGSTEPWFSSHEEKQISSSLFSVKQLSSSGGSKGYTNLGEWGVARAEVLGMFHLHEEFRVLAGWS